jgi:hypothetical protein
VEAEEEDGFGGWEAEEDEMWIEKGLKSRARKRGRDPKSVGRERKGL